MIRQFSNYRTPLAACVVAAGLFGFADAARAAAPPAMPAAPAVHPVAASAAASGGVLTESYRYHRLGHAGSPTGHPTIAPAEGWYGYGFPVSSYRWGWFGASRYYPRVVWHKGYYGDCCRWAYRSGY